MTCVQRKVIVVKRVRGKICTSNMNLISREPRGKKKIRRVMNQENVKKLRMRRQMHSRKLCSTMREKKRKKKKKKKKQSKNTKQRRTRNEYKGIKETEMAKVKEKKKNKRGKKIARNAICFFVAP